jgi:mono/diheme cytochrome c family protein
MKPVTAFILGLILLPILGVIAAFLGFLPSKATSTPPRWESAIAGRALDASLEKRTAGLTNPIKPGDSAALAAGASLYADNCAGCHGDAKGPSDWGSKAFYPRVPQFYQLKENELTPVEAYAAIHDGIRYSGMAAWRGTLKDDEMWKVANFVTSIREQPAQQQRAR